MKAVIIIAVLLILTIVFFPAYTPWIKKKIKQGNNALAELTRIKLGKSEQWVLIRTENIANPIVLFVHGSPGTSELTLNRRDTQELEKYFTVVNWDQRGAGKSYAAIADTGAMHIGQYVEDIHSLSGYLAKRFNQDKILLAGHSRGSASPV